MRSLKNVLCLFSLLVAVVASPVIACNSVGVSTGGPTTFSLQAGGYGGQAFTQQFVQPMVYSQPFVQQQVVTQPVCQQSVVQAYSQPVFAQTLVQQPLLALGIGGYDRGLAVRQRVVVPRQRVVVNRQRVAVRVGY